jgi:hypothetical protein
MPRQFQEALAKLIGDEQYRSAVNNSPQRITNDFRFTGAELNMLLAFGKADGGARIRHRMPGGCSSSCCVH